MKEKLVHEVWGTESRTEGGDEPAGVGTGAGGGGPGTHLREQQPRRLWTLQAKGWGSRGLTCFDQPDQRNPPEAEHVKNRAKWIAMKTAGHEPKRVAPSESEGAPPPGDPTFPFIPPAPHP